MNYRLFLIYVVILSTMQQGPAVYRDIACMEPEPGYGERLTHYFTATEVKKVCPTSADLAWRIGNDMFCSLLCVFLTLLLGHASTIGTITKERLSAMVSMVCEWRNRPSLCRHCGTDPCQVKRRCLWKPSGSRRRDKANFAERSNAMMLFSYGLALAVELTKELPRDDLYWERRFCNHFKEEHTVLFPLCIQRQINYWYPVPR